MTTAAEKTELQHTGLYDPANEHDACGVGFVAHIKGVKSHDIVQNGLLILNSRLQAESFRRLRTNIFSPL